MSESSDLVDGPYAGLRDYDGIDRVLTAFAVHWHEGLLDRGDRVLLVARALAGIANQVAVLRGVLLEEERHRAVMAAPMGDLLVRVTAPLALWEAFRGVAGEVVEVLAAHGPVPVLDADHLGGDVDEWGLAHGLHWNWTPGGMPVDAHGLTVVCERGMDGYRRKVGLSVRARGDGDDVVVLLLHHAVVLRGILERGVLALFVPVYTVTLPEWVRGRLESGEVDEGVVAQWLEAPVRGEAPVSVWLEGALGMRVRWAPGEAGEMEHAAVVMMER